MFPNVDIIIFHYLFLTTNSLLLHGTKVDPAIKLLLLFLFVIEEASYHFFGGLGPLS